MSARRSYRISSRRKRCSQANSRSATQRWRPRRSRDSIPLRAIRGTMPRARNPRRLAADRYPRSPCTLVGRRRGRPGRPRTGAIRSTIVRSVTTSGTFEAVSIGGASGWPCRSTIMWCFEPGFPRSVGLGPVAAPPFSPARARNRRRRATSRSLRRAGAVRVSAGGRAARRPPVASPAAASSTSCRYSQAPAVGPPRGCRCVERTQCRSMRRGRASSVVHVSIGVAASEAAVRSLPTIHRRSVVASLSRPSEKCALHPADSARISNKFRCSNTTAAPEGLERVRAARCGGDSSWRVPAHACDAAIRTTPSETRPSEGATAAPAPSGGGLPGRSKEPVSAEPAPPADRSLRGRRRFFSRHRRRRLGDEVRVEHGGVGETALLRERGAH